MGRALPRLPGRQRALPACLPPLHRTQPGPGRPGVGTQGLSLVQLRRKCAGSAGSDPDAPSGYREPRQDAGSKAPRLSGPVSRATVRTGYRPPALPHPHPSSPQPGTDPRLPTGVRPSTLTPGSDPLLSPFTLTPVLGAAGAQVEGLGDLAPVEGRHALIDVRGVPLAVGEGAGAGLVQPD